MKVIGLTWTAFRLPFREAFHTAGGSLTQRQGLLLRLATDAGFEGLGEASPHPALGPLALRDVQEALERLGPRLLETEVADIESLNVDIPPALACALDVAACDALFFESPSDSTHQIFADTCGGRRRVADTEPLCVEAFGSGGVSAAAAHPFYRAARFRVGR